MVWLRYCNKLLKKKKKLGWRTLSCGVKVIYYVLSLFFGQTLLARIKTKTRDYNTP